MFKMLEELFLFYLLYKLIFDLIIPAAQTARQVKKQFTDMQSNMHEHAERNNQRPASNYTTPTDTASKKTGSEDYIEFEEIK
jgi:hypothetical protein